MKDYYKILGIAKGASEDEVKKAYRRLAHQHHPDKAGGNEQKFKEINEAYQVLSDRRKRETYDRFGTAEPGAGFSAGAGGGFSWEGFGFDPQGFGDMGDFGDVFESLFENLGVRPRRKTYAHGSDLEIKEDISLEEALRGTAKRIAFTALVQCSSCKGKGADQDAGFSPCATCAGQGEVRVERRTFFGSFSQVKQCAQCRGAGQIPKKACRVCGGSGRVSAQREVEVEILPGIEDDQLIQVKGQGEAGERAAAAGDLYVRVRVKPNPMFERRGNDLVVKRELKLTDVLLGRRVEIPTLAGGMLHVEIPPNFNLKDMLRVPGEGMPHFGSSRRGDLLVDFILKAPGRMNPKVKKAFEDLLGE
ncbi:MAG: J domain-containing protein [Candidatus Liptonbacteria bacterium]|nr:J domain-containing protein [Candidatus Liptonbacteria bacterium]